MVWCRGCLAHFPPHRVLRGYPCIIVVVCDGDRVVDVAYFCILCWNVVANHYGIEWEN
jgi:hypothetical protein